MQKKEAQDIPRHTGSIQQASQGKEGQKKRGDTKNLTQPHPPSPITQPIKKSRLKVKVRHLYTTLSKTKNYTQKNFSTYELKTLHCQKLSCFFPSTPSKKGIKEPTSKLFCTSCQVSKFLSTIIPTQNISYYNY